MNRVTGGEVGPGRERHAEAEREPPSSGGCITGPEFNVMEAENWEAVGPGVRPGEVLVTH